MEATTLPSWLYELNDKTQKLGAPLYVVGGYLRDKIPGIKSTDIDLAGPANLEIFEECARIYPEISIKPESKKLGTLKIKYMDNSCEYTCFRSDSYAFDGSHTPDSVTLGADINEDAKKRDFTINAFYYDLTKRELLDFSSGMDDIHNRTIRCVREPIDVFSEDALRILRLVQQSTQLDFSIAEETLIGAKKCAHLLKNLAPQRVQVELTLMLMADAKNSGNSGIIKGLKLCEELGVLKNLFPQLQSCRGIMQRPEYHDHDVLDHLFYSCAASKSDIISRLAALFHDIGKPVVAKNGTMHGHDKVSVDITR